MPSNVPVIQDSAQLQTDTGRQRVQATPDAFGAQEAQAVGRLGQGLGAVAQVAAEKDDELARTEALELDNELSRRVRERLYSPESGYLSTQRGRNAVDGVDTVNAELDAMAVEVGASARPRARALYVEAARRRVADAFGQVATHAARENTSYQNEVDEAALSEYIDNAVAAYGDPGAVAAQVDGARTRIGAIAERLGWDETVRDQRIRQVQSDISSRVIVQLAATDPDAAMAAYHQVRPSLSAQDAGELLTTTRAAIREAEDGIIDEAWAFVSEGQAIPAELWARVPGRARIDIQNERRRRAEGGAAADPWLVAELQVMAMENPEQFAQADLRAVRSQLGPQAWATLSQAQTEIRNGSQDQTVNQQSETFNALVRTAENALAPYGVDITITEGMENDERRRAIAFRAALQRELEAFGGRPTAEEAQVLIGRAVVSMRGADVPGGAGNLRVEGRRGRNARSAVRPSSQAVVPYGAINERARLQIGDGLQRRLGRVPTQGEVENAYAAILQANPRTADELDQVYSRIIVGGGE